VLCDTLAGLVDEIDMTTSMVPVSGSPEGPSVRPLSYLRYYPESSARVVMDLFQSVLVKDPQTLVPWQTFFSDVLCRRSARACSTDLRTGNVGCGCGRRVRRVRHGLVYGPKITAA
jgi:hypothetical protein